MTDHDNNPIADPHHRRADMRMVERAINEGWDIPPDVMKAWPQEVIKIVGDKKLPVRDRIRAMKLMTEMHGQNQKDRHHESVTVNITNQMALGVNVQDELTAMDATVPEALEPAKAEGIPPVPGKNGHHKGNGKA